MGAGEEAAGRAPAPEPCCARHSHSTASGGRWAGRSATRRSSSAACPGYRRESDRARTGPGRSVPHPWAPGSTAVSVILAGHLGDTEGLQISFEGDKNRGLERGKGGKANKQIAEPKRAALRKERGSALTGFLMNTLRNKTGPAACDHLQGLGVGQMGQVGRRATTALGKTPLSRGPRRAQEPCMPAAGTGPLARLSPDSLTPARSSDSLPA